MINTDDMQKFSPEALIPLSELQRAPGKIIKRLQESPDPFLILDRGRPSALLLNKEQYAKLLSQTEKRGQEKETRKEDLLKALGEMLPLIIEKYKAEKIILFGSLAKGDVKETSDIDLLIVKNTKKRPIERQKELITLVQPDVACDFFIYTPQEFQKGLAEKKAFFVKEIQQNGKTLYEKAP